jgi:hypothetical protein
VISHRSAAALWDARPSARSRIEITAPRKLRSRAGIQQHKSRLAADEVTVSRDIPAPPPPRTLVDLATVVPPPQLNRALSEAEVLRLKNELSVRTCSPATTGWRVIRITLAAAARGARRGRIGAENAHRAG